MRGLLLQAARGTRCSPVAVAVTPATSVATVRLSYLRAGNQVCLVQAQAHGALPRSPAPSTNCFALRWLR